MQAFLSQVRLNLILAARNRMGLIYGFLFPLIFLGAFWALYRHDEVPLALHLGELLTVTILGGACFGLPTTIVSERERGVWRRYRLTPAPTWLFVASLIAARFVLIAAAALMQIGVALAVGMPIPADPLGLMLAFALASAAFLGLGMVIAMLAGNVPAVQALGQCIFLPMLMVGGVAVRLSTLPPWALHVSAFFPGRYAVTAIQRSVTGAGQAGGGFELLALALVAAAGCIAAVGLFRWDRTRRPIGAGGRLAVMAAIVLWAAVGLLAHLQGRVAATEAVYEDVGSADDFVAPASRPPVAPVPPPAASPRIAAPEPAPATVRRPAPPAPAAPKRAEPASWRDVGPEDYRRVAFEHLPPDDGLVAPIAGPDLEPEPLVAERLDTVRKRLFDWAPGLAGDPVQRARNLLYVAAVPDLLQMGDIERFLPSIVFERLKAGVSDAELAQILYWVAMHPDDGDDSAIGQLESAGLPGVTGPTKPVRGRVMLYAFKLLGRLTGDIKPAPAPQP